LSTVKDVVTKALFPAETLKDLCNSSTPSSPIKPDTATPKSMSKTKKKLNGTNWRQGMFNAKINNADEAAAKGLKVTITDKGGQDLETWVEDVRCLKCGQVLD
jgi:hypothetical protein